MSKRAAEHQGGDERYGAFGGQGQGQQEDTSDRPKQASAALLARRKIAQLKTGRRPRSESPMTNTGSIFEQANQNGLLGANNMQAQANPFGSTPSFNFGDANTNGATTPSFGSGGGNLNFGGNGQQTASTAQPGNDGLTFGSNNSATPSSSFVFGQSQPQPMQSQQSNGFTPSTTFSFGQPQPSQGNEAARAQFGSGQTNAGALSAAPGMFGSAVDASRDPNPKPQFSFGGLQDSSKTASNIFGGSTPAQPSQNGTNGFSFGAVTKPPADQSRDATPKPQTGTFMFGGIGQAQSEQAPAKSEQATTNGWAAFTQPKPAEATKPATNGSSTPRASIFPTAPQASGNSSSVFSGFDQPANKAATFQFSSTAPPADIDASMMSPENTPQKPASSTFGSSTVNGFSGIKTPGGQESGISTGTPKSLFDAGKGHNLFDRITKDDSAEPAAPRELFGSAPPAPPPSTTPAKNLFQPQTSLFYATTTSSTNTAAAKAPTPDAEAPPARANGQLTDATSMSATKPEHFVDIRELNESLLQHLRGQDADRDWSTIFHYYLAEVSKVQTKPQSSAKPSPGLYIQSTTQGNATAQTPAAKPSFNFGNSSLGKPTTTPTQNAAPANFGNFAHPPVTAPTNHTSSIGSARSGGTPQEQPLYPKLPDNASNTAKLFQAALDKPTTSTSATTSLFTSRSTADQQKPGTPAPTTGGFQPPVVPTTASSFLSSFGQQAKDTAEKEKKRRRDEDFDSDEDNEEEWEKRDAEEQAQKKAKLAEASKAAGGFVFKPLAGAGTTPKVFSGFGKPAGESQAETASETPSATQLKLFGNATAAAPATPATAPPKFGLFGSSTTPAPMTNGTHNIFASAAKSAAPSFSFGQNSTPAPTPAYASQTAANTAEQDGEDGDAAPPEQQAEDMAILLPSESSENDVLLHIEKSKSRKLESRPGEGSAEQRTWVDKGLGPLWILRDKATGKSRVLQKIKDSGRAAMNFAVLAGNDNLYKHEGLNGKAVMATFVDHLGSKDGKLSQWVIMVGKPDGAATIARILKEEQKRA